MTMTYWSRLLRILSCGIIVAVARCNSVSQNQPSEGVQSGSTSVCERTFDGLDGYVWDVSSVARGTLIQFTGLEGGVELVVLIDGAFDEAVDTGSSSGCPGVGSGEDLPVPGDLENAIICSSAGLDAVPASIAFDGNTLSVSAMLEPPSPDPSEPQGLAPCAIDFEGVIVECMQRQLPPPLPLNYILRFEGSGTYSIGDHSGNVTAMCLQLLEVEEGS